jgi:hypothetical protein
MNEFLAQFQVSGIESPVPQTRSSAETQDYDCGGDCDCHCDGSNCNCH